MTAILELREAAFRYRRAATPALDDVSFAVEPGRSLGLVGESGAGKTTALSLLLGLAQPTSGAVLFDGEPLDPRDREQLRVGEKVDLHWLPAHTFVLDADQDAHAGDETWAQLAGAAT